MFYFYEISKKNSSNKKIVEQGKRLSNRPNYVTALHTKLFTSTYFPNIKTDGYYILKCICYHTYWCEEL